MPTFLLLSLSSFLENCFDQILMGQTNFIMERGEKLGENIALKNKQKFKLGIIRYLKFTVERTNF